MYVSRNRRSLLSLFCALALLGPLGGCKLPSLPRLPSFPKLPTPGQLLPSIAPGSKGETLKDALKLAQGPAGAWSATAEPLMIQGQKLDPGGRNGGYATGLWILTYQATDKKTWYEVRVAGGKASPKEVEIKSNAGAALPRDLSGLLDSPDVMSKAGVSGLSFTMVLRMDSGAPVFNVVEEGGTSRAVLDAASGAKR